MQQAPATIVLDTFQVRHNMKRSPCRPHWPAVVVLLLVPTIAIASGGTDVPEAAEVCLSCHAFQPGEEELEGPTLWQVVGRRIAGVEGYPYSDALRQHGQATWDRPTLERFLAAPQQFAPGVNMAFGGVPRAADREVVLDFLTTLTPEGARADAEPVPEAEDAERGKP